MLAYHGDKSVKAKYLARVRRHSAADAIIQGQEWEDGKGCAVGCTLEAYDHGRYPIELGIPLQLAHLEDRLFEMSAKTDAQKWPAQFLRAIPVGADLSGVWPAFAVWLLVDGDFGVVRFARSDQARSAIMHVADLYRRGGTRAEFAAARSAAAAHTYTTTAARAATYAAAAAYTDYTYAAAAAYTDYTYVADAARADYADYAAADYAERRARLAWVAAARAKLLNLLRAAPVVTR